MPVQPFRVKIPEGPMGAEGWRWPRVRDDEPFEEAERTMGAENAT